MTRFEDRHRELRKSAGGYPYADEDAGVAAEEAEDRLRDFYGRTGPLVDDLVAAVREERRQLLVHGAFSLDAGIAVDAALAALDEASDRG